MMNLSNFRKQLKHRKGGKGIRISKGVVNSALLVPLLLYAILVNLSLTWNRASSNLDSKVEIVVPHRLQAHSESNRMVNATLTPETVDNENVVSTEKSAAASNEIETTTKKKNGVWPPGCTWKCYLRSNQDLLKMFGTNRRAARKHWRKHGKKENRPCGCKVVLLAGPHKAASTTIQWISTVYASMLNLQWEWLVPESYSQDVWKWSQIKAFAPFVFTYYGTKDKAKDMTFAELKDTYKAEFEKQWNDGNNNILFGSEAIDLAVDPENKDRNVIDEIIDIVPKEAVEYITTLVVYRSTRISHLKSLWKEIGVWHNSTFYEFLLHEDNDAFTRFYHSVDSLRLAAAFLEKGIEVQLLDLSGVNTTDNDEELYKIFGCDIMGLHCALNDDNTRMPVTISRHTPKDAKYLQSLMTAPQNVKHDNNYVLNVTDGQMKQIDELLRRHDCTYEEWIHEGDKLKILNGNEVMTNMEDCRTTFKGKELNQEELFRSVKEVLLSISGVESTQVVENGITSIN